MKYIGFTLSLAVLMTAIIGTNMARAADEGLPECPVMGEPIDFSVSAATKDGPVFFCCAGCIKKFEANPEKYASDVAGQRKFLAKREKIQVRCPVSGEPVDQKVSTEHKGEKVSFCCKDCIDKYTSDPAKYKTALANSYTYQTKCPVMGESIDPKSFSVLSTGQTVYYCCKGCDKKFLANPAKYAPKLAVQGVTINVEKLSKAGANGDGHDHDHDHDHGH